MANTPALYREIAEKRKILREQYGGMMTLKDVQTEFGFGSHHSAQRAIDNMGIPATKVGGRKKYDTDSVAKRLVELRGMV